MATQKPKGPTSPKNGGFPTQKVANVQTHKELGPKSAMKSGGKKK